MIGESGVDQRLHVFVKFTLFFVCCRKVLDLIDQGIDCINEFANVHCERDLLSADLSHLRALKIFFLNNVEPVWLLIECSLVSIVVIPNKVFNVVRKRFLYLLAHITKRSDFCIGKLDSAQSSFCQLVTNASVEVYATKIISTNCHVSKNVLTIFFNYIFYANIAGSAADVNNENTFFA